MDRAYYAATFEEFVRDDENAILGELTRHHGHELNERQRNAWLSQIRHLREVVSSYTPGHLFFEFSIPRMGRRADVVLLFRGSVCVLEYKVGAAAYHAADIDQVIDYALDLKNFHAGSHSLSIVPILVATAAPAEAIHVQWGADDVAEPIRVNEDTLHRVLDVVETLDRPPIVASEWANAPYQPTPTIVEAAKALYGQHSVEEISRADAGAINLSRTSRAVNEAIEFAKQHRQKIICFITGVPGSGKTLAGLNLATTRSNMDQAEHAVFLSGNGPLVKVLREALARDVVDKEGIRKSDAVRKVETFIQNIHHFRDEALRSEQAPIERVVVFDESQRAWTREEQSRFMKEKRGQTDFAMSEPEFLLSVMDRHDSWCAVVCLVGSGQEINKGEAGIAEWLRAIRGRYKSIWRVYCPERQAFAKEQSDVFIDGLLSEIAPETNPALHLDVCIRSFRSEAVSEFVRAVISGDCADASRIRQALDRYPLVVTRSLKSARTWLRTRARGTERYGLVASSNALRLRPVGVFVKSQIDVAAWFLNRREDVRSSYALEEAASEFEIQGLELDWVGVCWDANLHYAEGQWKLQKFVGTAWQQVQKADRQLYLLNSYRVLLTRARQGMVIFVPEGSDEDPTRFREYYDGTFAFLRKCGLAEI